MWKEKEPPSSDDGENKQTQDDHWVCQGVTLAPTSSKVARWCLNVPGLLAVNAIQDVIILQEQALCYFFGQKVISRFLSPRMKCMLYFTFITLPYFVYSSLD